MIAFVRRHSYNLPVRRLFVPSLAQVGLSLRATKQEGNSSDRDGEDVAIQGHPKWESLLYVLQPKRLRFAKSPDRKTAAATIRWLFAPCYTNLLRCPNHLASCMSHRA